MGYPSQTHSGSPRHWLQRLDIRHGATQDQSLSSQAAHLCHLSLARENLGALLEGSHPKWGVADRGIGYCLRWRGERLMAHQWHLPPMYLLSTHVSLKPTATRALV